MDNYVREVEKNQNNSSFDPSTGGTLQQYAFHRYPSSQHSLFVDPLRVEWIELKMVRQQSTESTITQRQTIQTTLISFEIMKHILEISARNARNDG